MSWTDERVSQLTKLWQDGLSASQIAAELGGVTRNAVIGKVHRLGMSGRDKPAGTGGKKAGTTGEKQAPAARRKTETRAASTAAPAASTPPPVYARTNASSGGATFGNAALKMNLEEQVEEEPVVMPSSDDVVVPISRKLDLLQLTENTCKWPTGDPTMPGFSFCGQQTADEKPYCEFHAKIAFQPPSERRRRR